MASNPFKVMIQDNGNKPTDEVHPIENKKPKVVEKKAKVETQNVRDTSFLYRLNSNFYRELQMFAKIKGESVNTIVEQALLAFIAAPANSEDYIVAKSLAEKIKK